MKNLKFLRNTPLNKIIGSGFTEVRKLEKEAPEKYKERVREAINLLTDENLEQIIEAVSYPEQIKGFENVKKEHYDKAEEFWKEKIASIKQNE